MAQPPPNMTQGVCMCCDLLLRFPVQISCFRCTVCDTITDLQPTSTAATHTSSTGLPLSYSLVSDILLLEHSNMGQQQQQQQQEEEVVVDSNNPTSITTTPATTSSSTVVSQENYQLIVDSFTHLDTLNQSFPLNHGEPCPYPPISLSLDDVDKTFKLIYSSHPKLADQLNAAILKLVKRPGKRLTQVSDTRFLLILMQNPFLYVKPLPLQAHAILSHILGLLSCLPNDAHHHIVSYCANVPMLSKMVDLVNYFITFRLMDNAPPNNVTVSSGSVEPPMRDRYWTDWRIKNAARVMALLFASNSKRNGNNSSSNSINSVYIPHQQRPPQPSSSITTSLHPQEKLLVSYFYNISVDYVDLIKDFARWQEEKSGSFLFCQYPILISLGGKLQIMEADAKRQMADRFKEAFIRTALQGVATDPFLSIRVRRSNLIQDSLNQLSARNRELKKKLRIEFDGEAGVDAGGLTKEWFLLLVKDLFSPDFGMFKFDEESNLCWFNPASLENTEEYRLVGIVIGLAIYNSTILDIHLPLACFKKLLGLSVGLNDLGEQRPGFVRGLRQLLDYNNDLMNGGNVVGADHPCSIESVFGINFVAEYEAFGEVVMEPLLPHGEHIPVTRENRTEYVDKMVDWVLNQSIERQFEAFKAGFYHVCGGNALSLFRPEEIEMMVRGNSELDLSGLESVVEYEGFSSDDAVIRNFWNIVMGYSNDMKREFLMFATGSDRVPATGIQNMVFKISNLGEDCDKLPVAHTCFNQVCLYNYSSCEKLEEKLTKAIQWR